MKVRSAREFTADDVTPGPSGAPTAFRIWTAGLNVTDHGAHEFSSRSAATLLEEQTRRGNLYSIDVDHLSLSTTAPPEARKAVGWHKLAVVDGDLWAVDVEWTPAVAAGFATNPPEWRYFSPAYDVSRDTQEVVSYTNTALTNNPATWHVTALASRATKGTHMSLQESVAAAMGDDDEKKEAAKAAIKAMADDGDKMASKMYAALFGEPDGDEEEKPKKDKPEADTKQTAEADDDEEASKAATASIAASVKALEKLGAQDKRIAELEAIQDKEERARILGSRADLTKSQLAALADEPTAKLPKLLALIGKPAVDRAAAASVQATRGSGQGGADEVRAARLPQDENKDLRERMGTHAEAQKIHWERNDRVFPIIDKVEARRMLGLGSKGAVK